MGTKSIGLEAFWDKINCILVQKETMRIRSSILIVSGLSIFFSCNQNETKLSDTSDSFKTYYSSLALRESPYPGLKGIVQLSSKTAQVRNHYLFEYDSLFRIKQVSFRLRNSLRPPNHTASYFFTTSIQKYAYKGNKVEISFFDEFENQTNQRGVWKEVYELNEMGKKVALYFQDQNENEIENSWGIARYDWVHKFDGSIIETRADLNGNPKPLRPGFEFYKIRLSYEPSGFLAVMQNIDDDGKLIANKTGVAQDKLLFDETGKWYGWNVLDENHQLKSGNGPNVAKGINVPNKFGYESSIRYEDENGQSRINRYGFWGSKRFYDSVGNYDYTYFTDSLGNPGINQNSGYCYARYYWDAKKLKRTKIELLDPYNKLVNHKTRGYAIIKFEYDNNRLIKTTYLDEGGKLVNRKDNGTAYITYEYIQEKNTTMINRFDKEGNKNLKD